MICHEAVFEVHLLIVFANRKATEREFINTSYVFALLPFWFIQVGIQLLLELSWLVGLRAPIFVCNFMHMAL